MQDRLVFNKEDFANLLFKLRYDS